MAARSKVVGNNPECTCIIWIIIFIRTAQASKWKDTRRFRRISPWMRKFNSNDFCVLDIVGLITHEYVLSGQTVSTEFYTKHLQSLLEAMRSHRLEKLCTSTHLSPWHCPYIHVPQKITFRFFHTLHQVSTWSCLLRFLLVPTTDENTERSIIQLSWKDSNKRDETNEGSRKWFKELLP